jgi:hypothetical protein
MDKASHENVNERCKDWTGYITAWGDGSMAAPDVVPIFWGSYFREHGEVVGSLGDTIKRIISGPFMDGLQQYGVTGKCLCKEACVDSRDPSDARLDRAEVLSELKSLVRTGQVDAPKSDEKNLLYVIFTPPGKSIVFQDLVFPRSLVGYHHWDFYGRDPATDNNPEPNLFFAVIPWPVHNGDMEMPFDAVHDKNRLDDILSQIISNELAEAFTDRNGLGYKNPADCEICDICETNDDASEEVDGLRLQKYWSNDDQRCIAHQRSNRARTGQMLSLTGHPVNETREGITLYLDSGLSDYVMIKRNDIQDSIDISPDISPVPARTVRFGRDARIRQGTRAAGGQPDPNSPENPYLAGSIHKKYMNIAGKSRPPRDPLDGPPIGTAPSGCASEAGFCPSQQNCP